MSESHLDLPERPTFLIVLASGPAIWFAHFLVTYTTVAVACGSRGPSRDALAGAQMLVLAYTLVALGGITVVARSGWRRHRHGAETVPHDMDTPGDRHRFLGFATYLLAILSAMATLFVAVATALLPDCR
jgi:hypothetical protein